MGSEYWKTKKLTEMTATEWESLCDGCGKCCVLKLEDEETAEVTYTSLSCVLFNPKTCRCSNYYHRHEEVKECLKISPKNLQDITYLPKTCAYKLISEGKDLPDWHHLLTKDPQSVHKSGSSMYSWFEESTPLLQHL